MKTPMNLLALLARSSRPPFTARITAALPMLLAAAAPADTTPPVVPEPPAALTFASFNGSNDATAQGGGLYAFAYSEKPGDANLGKLSTANGVARATGTVGASSGSTWGGIGLMAGSGPAGKTVDLSAQRTLHLQLASATATQLRVRVMGNDKATRDNGCYPVVVQKVTAELRDYAIPLSAFAPEAYCAAQGRPIATIAAAVAAIEVSDPAMSAALRPVDFQVGRIELRP
jgi:hypothetical protein